MPYIGLYLVNYKVQISARTDSYRVSLKLACESLTCFLWIHVHVNFSMKIYHFWDNPNREIWFGSCGFKCMLIQHENLPFLGQRKQTDGWTSRHFNSKSAQLINFDFLTKFCLNHHHFLAIHPMIQILIALWSKPNINYC